MIISEIALEGIRCFKQQCRFVPKQGYNLLCGPNESGKTSLLECINIVLDPLRQVSESDEFQTWGPPGNSRAGVVLAEGNNFFRVTRDFVNGLVSLSKYNPQTKKYEVVAQDHAKVESFLRTQLKMPTLDIFRKIFIIDKNDLPSGRGKVIVKKVMVQAAGGGAPVFGTGGGMPGMMPQAAPVQAMPPELIKQRIAELERQLEKAASTANLQNEVDLLESKLFENDTKLKEIKGLEQKIDQIQTSLKPYKSFAELPPDILNKVEFFEETERDHKTKINDVEGRYGRAKMDLTQLQNRGLFYKEQNFMIGAGAIVFGIVVAVVKSGMESSPPGLGLVPPLAIIVGLGAIFWVLWNEFDKRGKEGVLVESTKKLEEELKEEVKKFEVEGSVIKKLREEADAEDSKSLNKKLKEYKIRVETLEETKEKIIKAKRDANYDNIVREQEESRSKIEKLNKELQTSGGGFGMEPEDIKSQLASLKFALDNPGAAVAGVPAPMPMGMPPPIPGIPSMPQGNFGDTVVAKPAGGGADFLGGGGGDDFLGGGGAADFSAPMPPHGGNPGGFDGASAHGEAAEESMAGGAESMVDELWAAVEKVAGLSRSIIIPQVAERFNVYLQAFTGKKYNEGDLSSEKTMSLRSAMGSYTDFMKLSPSTQDAAWLALKIAIVENLSQKIKMPLILDDPLRYLDENRLGTVSKALKKIGSMGQVILLSTQRAHSKVADNTIEIGGVPPTPPPA